MLLFRDVLSHILLGPQRISDLQERAATQCSSGYTAPNGLNFRTYCETDFPCPSPKPDRCDIKGGNKQASLIDCMRVCAIDRAGCYGVSYSTADGVCYLKGNYTTMSLKQSNTTIQSALVDDTQLRAPANLSCPYVSSSTISTRGGMQFDVLCNTEFSTGQLCPWNSTCEPHAKSLDECLGFCEASHPLCTGVTWNPDMLQGYGNCYLRYNQNDGATPKNGVVMHSAKVTLATMQSTNTSITSTTWTASNGAVFNITKFDQRVGASNYTALHANGLESCMDSCAQRTNETCVGVLLDLSMINGYSNCYLLNGIGSAYPGTNYNFAQLTQAKSRETDAAAASSPPNMAWIAGPVVGGLVLLAIVVATVVFVFKRSRRTHKVPVYEHRKRLSLEKSYYHPVEAPNDEVTRQLRERYGNINTPAEMPGQTSLFELPASKPDVELSGRDIDR